MAKDRQTALVHVFESKGVAGTHGVADAGLHVTPPSVISAAKANQVAAFRVVVRQPHGLHHRFGAGHMKRYFVEAGDSAEAVYVDGSDRVIGAEHRAQIADTGAAAFDAS